MTCSDTVLHCVMDCLGFSEAPVHFKVWEIGLSEQILFSLCFICFVLFISVVIEVSVTGLQAISLLSNGDFA